MFSFLKNLGRSKTKESYFPVITDMHSHILPGIDDGSPDVETSLRLIRGLMDMGLTGSIATPHVISDLYRNTPETISTSLTTLQEALRDNNIDFKLSAAAEYMLDADFFQFLDEPGSLLTIHDNLILTEFSFSYMPTHPEEMAFKIITEGYTPILAHPERYGFYHNNYKMYERLKELGFLLQVNLLSLTGYYGAEVAKAARHILSQDLASFVGTDLHHEKHLLAFRTAYESGIFYNLLGHRRWNEELNQR